MPINTIGMGYLAASYALSGIPLNIPSLRNQVEKASKKVTTSGPDLELLLTTPNIGIFELQALPTVGVFLNYAMSSVAPKTWLYRTTALPIVTSTTPRSSRPKDYVQITPLKSGKKVTFFLNEPVGSAKLDLRENAKGVFVYGRIKLYDASGKLKLNYRF